MIGKQQQSVVSIIDPNGGLCTHMASARQLLKQLKHFEVPKQTMLIDHL